MCVCVCIDLYVWKHTYVYTNIVVRAYIIYIWCKNTCAHTHTSARMLVNIPYVYTGYAWMCTCVLMTFRMHDTEHKWIHVLVGARLSVYMHMYVCTYIYKSLYMYMYLYLSLSLSLAVSVSVSFLAWVTSSRNQERSGRRVSMELYPDTHRVEFQNWRWGSCKGLFSELVTQSLYSPYMAIHNHERTYPKSLF